MHQFTDSKGQVWELSINVASLRRVKDKLQLDLTRVIAQDDNTLAKLADPETLANVLWVLVEGQAEAKGISPESFAEGLAGESIDSATESLLQELSDFFPRAQRTLIKAALAKTEKMQETVIRIGLERLEALNPEKMLAQSSGDSSTRPPALSA
jgi:hypothetical protein